MIEPEIVVVGSLNMDLVVRVPSLPAPGQTITGRTLNTFSGGKGANQAYAAGKLGARVRMIGQVGNDTAGEAQITNLHSVEVTTEHIARVSDASTGTAVIAVQDNGENCIIIVPGANGNFFPDRLPVMALRSARFALFQLEIPLETVSKAIAEADAAGLTVILDPAPAPDNPLPAKLLGMVDYLTPNLVELAKLSATPLTEDSPLTFIAEAARKLGVAKVIAKLGPRGVLIVTPTSSEHVPGFRVKVVDTTGAGDCFNAAFAVALSQGSSESEAARFANAAAALSVTRPGAQASMPSVADVLKFLNSSL